MIRKIMMYLLLSTTIILASDYTMEDLNKLKDLNMISNEEYEIFKNELQGTSSGKEFFSLNINGLKVSEIYPVIKEQSKEYFPIINFFNVIGFKNYDILDGNLVFKLGTNDEKIVINTKNKTILGIKDEKKISYSDKELIVTDSDFYIESELFKKIFLKSFRIDNENYKIAMSLSFETPEEIKMYLRNVQDGLIESQNAGEMMFTNRSSLFDLGNIGVDIEAYTERQEGDNKFDTDWSGNIEYQGGLLYGEFTLGYDIRNKELGDMSLYYPDIWKDHSFEVSNLKAIGEAREWEVIFRKEKGYFKVGRNFVIRENVPIGSKVELLYLGFPIEIKEAENGTVEFTNSEIQENRQYTLRVYTPAGKVYTIDVNTTSDYNQQKKGEIEYDISLRENDLYNKYESHANVYYGLTNNFTTGLKYHRKIESDSKGNTGYIDSIRAEGVYSNVVYRYPYTVVLGGDKALKSFRNTEGESDKERYGYDYKGQIDIGNFRFKAENQHFGRYFDEEKIQDYSVTYNPLGAFQINYDWGKTKYYDGSKDSNESVGFNASKAFKELLVSLDYNKSLNNQDTYRANLYYNGLKNYNVQLLNEWGENGKEYQTTLSISNKNIFDIFDYTIEFSYSEKEKEKFTFSFHLDYNNWFTTDIDINGRNQRYAAGIDKVFDLRDITKNVETLDSSRVKVITYLDENNNGIRDKNEKTVENVIIKLRSDEQKTDEDGVAWFHGIPNDVIYDMVPTVIKPDYTTTNSKMKILGRKVGTVEAEIPIKPMLSLTGIFELDPSLNLSKKEKEIILENTLIKVIDSKGKLIEYINPELNGTFEINGLFSEKYTVEILYMGNDYNIQGTARNIQMAYQENGNKLVINYQNGKFSMKRSGVKEEGAL